VEQFITQTIIYVNKQNLGTYSKNNSIKTSL